MKPRRLGTVGTGTGPPPVLLQTQQRVTVEQLQLGGAALLDRLSQQLREQLYAAAEELDAPVQHVPTVELTLRAHLWVQP